MFGHSLPAKGLKRARWASETVGWLVWLTALGSIGRTHVLLLPSVIWVVAVIIAAVRKPSSTRFARIGAMLAAPYYPLARLGRMALKAHNDRTGAQVALKMESFDSLSGEEFEVQLGKLFQRQGYKVSATPRTGDFGADLLLKRDGEETVVQAKRYSQSVGIESVQQVIGAMAYYDVPHGMVVTNSHFTPAAHHMAQRAGIPLWDREHLAREIDQLDTTR